MTENSDKLDNMTVRRFAKLIKGNGSNNGSTGITTGTVIQNDNQLFVAVDDETLVPVSDTASNVNVGDKVTLAIDNEEALIVGNNSDASPTASELSETDTKATFAKVDASEAKDTAQTAQVTANTAQNTAETAQTTADNAQSTAQTAKETADAVDGKATEAKETATQAQQTATTASETATQAQTTANTAKETADTASTKADNAQSTADTASSKADNAQTTADTASSKADTAQTTAETAQARAEGAEKVATNFIDIDDNKGITVGDRTAGTLGKNTYIDANGVSIRDGDTVLASFGDDEIALGINSDDTEIRLGSSFCRIMQSNTGLVQLIAKGGFHLFNFDGTQGDLYIQNGTISWDGIARDASLKQYKTINMHTNDSILTIGDGCDNPKVVIKGKDTDGTLECAEIKKNGTSVAVEGHTHTTSDLTDADTLAKTGHKHTVSDITDYEPFDPSDYAKASHKHTVSDITDYEPFDPSDYAKASHKHTKSDITDFSHTHTKSEISDFAHNHAGDALTPATINTTSTIKQNGTQVSLRGHTHSASDVTSGTLAVAHGGTGKTAGTFYGVTVLYNNTTGTNGNVTLSASSANYTYLEIFYKCTATNAPSYNSVKVFSPNGKKVQLQQSFFASGTTTLQTDFELVSISTTTITRGTMGYIQHSGSASGCGTTTRQFNIVRVVGYK